MCLYSVPDILPMQVFDAGGEGLFFCGVARRQLFDSFISTALRSARSLGWCLVNNGH
ncbi:hypothetical protein HMPREF0305_12181 [Corynebacterium pseudogenitalium ATCC 33035]|uniref:Uncharacterized protein n=2 Tax=Corynebacterium pseudogenitalium TaxID=38303 RepID=E2S6M9_9CORY|nr:hypothetical protein HMPREF0305_12181 [Corynebacterium pseudogenitalium ATCC 33035]